MSKRQIRLLGLLAVPAIAIALVAFLSWGLGNSSSTPKASANSPHTGLNFWIGIGSQCDTDASSAPTANCNVSSGQNAQFTVDVHLDALPMDIPSYTGFDIHLTHTSATAGTPSAKASKDDPDSLGTCNSFRKANNLGTPFPNPTAVAGIPASLTGANDIKFGCAIGVAANQVSKIGIIGSSNFNCPKTAKTITVSLVNGLADTSLTTTGLVTHSTDSSTETLTISCKVPTSTRTPTQTATPTNTATNTPTATPPPVPRWLKAQRYPYTNAGSQCSNGAGTPTPTNSSDPCYGPQDPPLDSLGNLWLTRQGLKIPPINCQASSDNAVFSEVLQFTPRVPDPKGVHQFAYIGGFEFEVRFDPKLICVDLVPGEAAAALGLICFVDDMGSGQQLEGIARMGCVSKAKNKFFSKDLTPEKIPGGTIGRGPELAQVWVKPQPDLYSQIRPNQDNGVVAQLLDQNCELSDEQGHPIPIFSCEDADVTIRYLEGDVEPNCKIDAADQQNVAFRWGAGLGSLLYNTRYDLEPSGTVKGDGDVDIKDLQFVFGRFNSGCGRKLDNSANRPLCDSSIPPKPNATPVTNVGCSGHVLKALPQDSFGSPHPRQAPRNPKA